MLKHNIINLGSQIRHIDGVYYHTIDRLHLLGDDDSIYCVILEETDTRESPCDGHDVLVLLYGKFRLEDEDWADEPYIFPGEQFKLLFREGEAKIIYQNPQAFIKTYLL